MEPDGESLALVCLESVKHLICAKNPDPASKHPQQDTASGNVLSTFMLARVDSGLHKPICEVFNALARRRTARTTLISGAFETALVAQLDRASDFESEGREFESLRARQTKSNTYDKSRACLLPGKMALGSDREALSMDSPALCSEFFARDRDHKCGGVGRAADVDRVAPIADADARSGRPKRIALRRSAELPLPDSRKPAGGSEICRCVGPGRSARTHAPPGGLPRSSSLNPQARLDTLYGFHTNHLGARRCVMQFLVRSS